MPKHYNLKELGWTHHFEDCIKTGVVTGNGQTVRWNEAWLPARISADYGVEYEVFSPNHDGDRVVLAGPMRKARFDCVERPIVGDWVAIERHNHLVARLPRLTTFTRKAAGEEYKPQLLAANVDLVFIVTSMNREFNVRRLERYLTAVVESGAHPVIILNKIDLAPSTSPYLKELNQLGEPLDIVAISSLYGKEETLRQLEGFLKQGQTIALVGSSGVGKSTLTNLLVDEPILKTAEIRERDDEGRHTTTHREMVLLPENRGLLIDTPGMREFGLWSEEEAVEDTFDEITHASHACRFRDCRHENEPGCAVLAAIKKGQISTKRLNSWHVLQEEVGKRTERGNPRNRRWNK